MFYPTLIYENKEFIPQVWTFPVLSVGKKCPALCCTANEQKIRQDPCYFGSAFFSGLMPLKIHLEFICSFMKFASQRHLYSKISNYILSIKLKCKWIHDRSPKTSTRKKCIPKKARGFLRLNSVPGPMYIALIVYNKLPCDFATICHSILSIWLRQILRWSKFKTAL